MKFSIIVAFDNDFEIINNFFENLVATTDLTDGELIFVSDGCRDIKTLSYLKGQSYKNSKIKLIETAERQGYSITNNIGVHESKGDYLVFINSDVFPTKGSIHKLLNLLKEKHEIGAVQGLLIYPQTGKVQSTGHLFMQYQNCHAYLGANFDSQIVKKSGERQALTTAFCAVRKIDFCNIGMFDEIYYNAYEGMEMSLKISLLGKKCFYLADAIAYHIVGGSRKYIKYNNEIAGHIFWSKWHDKITEDIHTYIKPQLPDCTSRLSYFWIQASSMLGWDRVLNNLDICVSGKIELQDRFLNLINLYENLPFSFLDYPAPYVFTVDKMSDIKGNKKWITDRNYSQDIVLDSHGLFSYLSELIDK